MGRSLRTPIGVLGLVALLLASCGRPGDDEERPSRLVEFITPEGCELLPNDPRQMAGAYLREIEGPGIFDGIVMRGIERTNALRADVRVDERPVRPRPRGEIGSLINTRPGTAEPISGLGGHGGARGYTLRYAGDGLSYTGIALVGETPGGAEVPTSGQVRLSGPAELILRTNDGQDVPLSGHIDAVLGYGSRSGMLRLSQIVPRDGRALAFAAVTWSGLGLCGTRIVSTGQGSVRVTGADGRIVTPFGSEGAPTAARSTLNGFLIAGAERPSAPGGAGGVMLIQGDAASLRGGFALRAGN
jgi:hypothetical protein